MARIVLGSYMVRYPLGGMMSWVLQYLAGFHHLGHDVYFVEKAGYENACFDPVRGVMTDDCRYGTQVVSELLARIGLEDRWCFVDAAGEYYGVARPRIEEIFRSADVFIDMGTHGSWLDEAASSRLRVLIDGEPAFTQLKMEKKRAAGAVLQAYDHYYTTGQNVGTDASTAATAGIAWKHVFHPVAAELFDAAAPPLGAAYTTVMNWQSYEPVEHAGVRLAHKDAEFEKFLSLPLQVRVPLELAVSGRIPTDRLAKAGWRVQSAHDVTHSYDRFVDYITASRGEFSVCKSGYVVTNSGWFSDRSAAYLACGRPVVMQETGFSAHLPCGEGLFAVRTVDEAVAAIEAIESDYQRHASAAREIAVEHLGADRVLGRFLAELGCDDANQRIAGRRGLTECQRM